MCAICQVKECEIQSILTKLYQYLTKLYQYLTKLYQ